MISYNICLSLSYFTKHNALQVHPCCCKWQNSTLFTAEWWNFSFSMTPGHYCENQLVSRALPGCLVLTGSLRILVGGTQPLQNHCSLGAALTWALFQALVPGRSRSHALLFQFFPWDLCGAVPSRLGRLCSSQHPKGGLSWTPALSHRARVSVRDFLCAGVSPLCLGAVAGICSSLLSRLGSPCWPRPGARSRGCPLGYWTLCFHPTQARRAVLFELYVSASSCPERQDHFSQLSLGLLLKAALSLVTCGL